MILKYDFWTNVLFISESSYNVIMVPLVENRHETRTAVHNLHFLNEAMLFKFSSIDSAVPRLPPGVFFYCNIWWNNTTKALQWCQQIYQLPRPNPAHNEAILASPLHLPVLFALSGQQPNRPRELGDGHPFSQRLAAGQAPGEGGHGAPAAQPGPRPAAEDRHGREDEEDGRAAAHGGQQPQESQGDREPGEVLLLTPIARRRLN